MVKRLIQSRVARILKSKDGKLRKRLSVFLVCLLFSSIMWGMIKLTHEYEVTVNFRTEASAVPKGKILTSNTDSVLSITVKAAGIDFYSRLMKTQSNPLLLDLHSLHLLRKEDKYYSYLKTSRFTRAISDQLPSGVEIIAIEPDTLHFVFEKIYSKDVVVKPEVSLKFSRQYQLYDSIKISPDSVKVSGRKDIVETIRFISTEEKSYSGLKARLTDRLALIKPEFYPPVGLSADSVEIRLEVEKYTEASIEVPVKMNANRLKGSAYRTFPAKVELTCLVAMKDYKRLDASMFTLLADPESIKESTGKRVPVEVVSAPAFVRVIKVEPDMVEYLIIR